MCQRKEKLLTEKNTADKVSCVKNIYNRNIRLLTICHASNSKFYKNIYIHIIMKYEKAFGT